MSGPSPIAPDPVVLQVLPSLRAGGVERGTIEIAEAIRLAGGTALVASAGGRLASLVERAGGRNLILPLDTKNPWRIWRNAAPLEAAIRREHVALVHARSRAPAWSALWAARRAGVPFVTTYHAPYGEDVPLKRRYNAVMASGVRVIAISRYIAGLIAARHGTPPERIRVIPRGVDPALFDPVTIRPERLARLLAAWRVPDGHPIVLLPGRLARWKGHAVLIAALARVAAGDAFVVFTGEDGRRGAYATELAALAERHGVADRVRMVGHVEDMAAAYLLANVVVNASTTPEGFGRVVIEAQAMARPVIASAHGGAAETIAHGRTGVLVPPGDPLALAAAIDAVLAMPTEESVALGARARAEVAARYTVLAMQRATIEVYREVLD